MRKRLLVGIIAGAGLGIFCILGIGWRLGFDGNGVFLASAWFNRVIMGLVIGLANGLGSSGNRFFWFWRGAILGLTVSFAWFLDTGFRDPMGFLAGIAYGMVIDWAATRYGADQSPRIKNSPV